MPDVSRTPPSDRYRARDARASPFYRLVQDHLEEYLARTIEQYLKAKVQGDMPAQIHWVQRFGSALNQHSHVHAVSSDGLFEQARGFLGIPELRFHQAPAPADEDILRLTEQIRRKVLRRFVRLKVIPQAVADQMLSWKWSGFSLHAKTAIEARDRQGLEKVKASVVASAKSWAAILSRVFEADPLICAQCGGRLVPVAAILNDAELDRLLTHLGVPLDWPKTVPARSRPPPEEPAPGEGSQANPLADLYDGIDAIPAEC